MDPFTIALATFGVQKLRGKSTKRSLRDALFPGSLGDGYATLARHVFLERRGLHWLSISLGLHHRPPNFDTQKRLEGLQ